VGPLTAMLSRRLAGRGHDSPRGSAHDGLAGQTGSGRRCEVDAGGDGCPDEWRARPGAKSREVCGFVDRVVDEVDDVRDGWLKCSSRTVPPRRLGWLSVAVGMSVPQVVGGQIGRYADRASCRGGSRDDPGDPPESSWRAGSQPAGPLPVAPGAAGRRPAPPRPGARAAAGGPVGTGVPDRAGAREERTAL
jgi:hypothetical protein